VLLDNRQTKRGAQCVTVNGCVGVVYHFKISMSGPMTPKQILPPTGRIKGEEIALHIMIQNISLPTISSRHSD